MGYKDFEVIENSLIAFFVAGLPDAFTIINDEKLDGLIITPPTTEDLLLTINSRPVNTSNYVIAGISSMPASADSGRGAVSQDLVFDWIYTIAIGSNEDAQEKRKILFRKLSGTLLLLTECLHKQSFYGLKNGRMLIEVITPSDVVDGSGRPQSAMAAGVKLTGVLKP